MIERNQPPALVLILRATGRHGGRGTISQNPTKLDIPKDARPTKPLTPVASLGSPNSPPRPSRTKDTDT